MWARWGLRNKLRARERGLVRGRLVQTPSGTAFLNGTDLVEVDLVEVLDASALGAIDRIMGPHLCGRRMITLEEPKGRTVQIHVWRADAAGQLRRA
jgi:hypothetical protein